MSESLASFRRRVLAHTGLTLSEIPDAPQEELLGGSIAATSPWGTAVLKDPLPEYREDGEVTYTRAVMVGRSPDLDRPRLGATGLLHV